MAMEGLMLDKENLDIFLVICSFCKRYKNDDGYWEQSSPFLKFITEDRMSHGVCPECLKKNYPKVFSSLCDKGKIVIKEKISPDNEVLHGCFLTCKQ